MRFSVEYSTFSIFRSRVSSSKGARSPGPRSRCSRDVPFSTLRWKSMSRSRWTWETAHSSGFEYECRSKWALGFWRSNIAVFREHPPSRSSRLIATRQSAPRDALRNMRGSAISTMVVKRRSLGKITADRTTTGRNPANTKFLWFRNEGAVETSQVTSSTQ